MKLALALTASALALLTAPTWAEDAPISPHHLSGTVTLASDYAFKGMTQTWGGPALQGSLDYTHDSGFNASLWASNVSRKAYVGANLEIDVSAGYRRQLTPDWTVGAGLLGVFYPGGNYSKVQYASLPSQSYDFAEANVSVGWKWATLKYSRTLTDLAGFNTRTGYTSGTRGSSYLDLSADVPLSPALTLNLHAGHQDVTAELASPTAGGSTQPDFNDFRLGLTYGWAGGWTTSLAMVWNDNRAFYDATPSNHSLSDTRDVGHRRAVLSVTKTF